MFGYLKTFEEELKVKNLSLYNATYCGLCNTLSSQFSNIMSLFLSYDYVFLTLLRSAINKRKYSTIKKRCIVHPIKKKPIIKTNEDLVYAANISLLLTNFKVKDNINDKRGLSKLKYIFIKSIIKNQNKKVKIIDEDTKKRISSLFYEISKIEEKFGNLDELSSKFGEIMAIVFSYGIADNMNKKILQEIGYNVGKFIYYCDVTEDIFEDYKAKTYNPILTIYHFEDIYDKKHKQIINEDLKEILYNSAILTLENLAKAIELIDYSENRDIEEIIKNIVYLGLPNQFKKILNNLQE